jgi:hypothetical protein
MPAGAGSFASVGISQLATRSQNTFLDPDAPEDQQTVDDRK